MMIDDYIKHKVKNVESNERLDKYISKIYPEKPRSHWRKVIQSGLIKVNEVSVGANYKVKVEDELLILVIDKRNVTALIPENINLNIIFEDNDIIAINKPAGLVMHPGIGHYSGTLANGLIYHYPETFNVGGERRPGLIHRLDKNTSGVVLVAKNDEAHRFVVEQFKSRQVKKTYYALVHGRITQSKGNIDAPIGKNPDDPRKMSVWDCKKEGYSEAAQTSYKVVQKFDQYTLLQCFPKTGRTHQIRVHLAYLGYPIVGDYVYGQNDNKLMGARHFLHACQLSFIKPSDKQEKCCTDLEAPLPSDLKNILNLLD